VRAPSMEERPLRRVSAVFGKKEFSPASYLFPPGYDLTSGRVSSIFS
jgi:hypothetical protein